MLDPEILAALFLVATVAGWIDAIAGGGGIIMLPSLMLAGLSPLQALATNKLQACFGSGTSTLNFIAKRKIQLRAVWPGIACTAVGAAAGTWTVQRISNEALQQVIPVLLIALSLFLLFGMKWLMQRTTPLVSYGVFALLIGGGVGFYDGFFGPGTGTLFAVGHMLLLGQNMVNATINTKLLNFTSNVVALVFFISGGHVLWVAGLVMALGQMLGAYVGSNMVIDKGTRLIRPLLIIMSLVISIKLLLFP